MPAAKEASHQRPWGAYIHFPWCLKKCPYCDFLSIPVESQRLVQLGSGLRRGQVPDATSARSVLPHEAYADAVLSELKARLASWQPDSRPASVFFGGGTPSLWDPEQLGRVVRGLLDRPFGAHTSSAQDVEVTVECNPTSFDEEHARRLQTVGVNRVSLGVQSLNAERLQFLGRLHDASGALNAIDAARRAGVPRVSCDLIFGVVGQSPAEAAQEASQLAQTGITHLSAYALTIEPNTHFGTLARRGKLPLLDEGLVAESFVAVRETLERHGFVHYEVSNYARGGHVALHNLGYWRGHDYLGLGVGAWGTVRSSNLEGARVRYRNTASVERYLEAWTKAPSVAPFDQGFHLTERELIDPETSLRERILLGLRLAEGLDVASAAEELGVSPWSPARERAKHRLIAKGRLEEEGSRLTIPPSQWLFADGIIAELL